MGGTEVTIAGSNLTDGSGAPTVQLVGPGRPHPATKRLVGRGRLAPRGGTVNVTVTTPSGGTSAAGTGDEFSYSGLQVSFVASASGASQPTAASGVPAAQADITPMAMAVDQANGDEAILSQQVTPGGGVMGGRPGGWHRLVPRVRPQQRRLPATWGRGTSWPACPAKRRPHCRRACRQRPATSMPTAWPSTTRATCSSACLPAAARRRRSTSSPAPAAPSTACR